MMGTSLLATFIAAFSLGPALQQAQDPKLDLRIATPTYFSDGKVLGASASGWGLRLSQPVTLYAYSGRTLCESSSPTTSAPIDAGYGWRLQIVPLRHTDVLVLQVDWQRLWDRGQKLTNGQRGKAQVTLHPGDRILFDYLSVGERALSPNMATEVTRVTGQSGCDAVGMGLEISFPPVESPALVETNLWLVRTLTNGTEQSQHQTIRVRPGTSVEFFFDDVNLGLTDSKGKAFFFFNGAGSPPVTAGAVGLSVRTSGRISPIEIANGKVQMDVMIAQSLTDVAGPADRRPGGSSTFRLTAGPDEVLSFQVPRVPVNGGQGERLALRVQVRQIR